VNDLAAFRGGSDIEYSIDDGYVLTKDRNNVVGSIDEEYTPKKLVLRHVKSRNSLTMHIPLLFDGRLQEFTLRKWEDQEAYGIPRIASPTSVPVRKKTDGLLIDTFSDNFKEDADGTTWLS
jgi:hypothetical protein